MTHDIRDAAMADTAVDDSGDTDGTDRTDGTDGTTVDPALDGHGDPQELDDPDEEAVRRLLKGPPNAIGQVYREAAGLDPKFPDEEAKEAAKDVPPAGGDGD